MKTRSEPYDETWKYRWTDRYKHLSEPSHKRIALVGGPPRPYRPNSVRDHRYICEILKLYVPGVGLLIHCSVPRGGFLYTVIVPGRGFLLPSSRVQGVCPRGGDGYG